MVKDMARAVGELDRVPSLRAAVEAHVERAVARDARLLAEPVSDSSLAFIAKCGPNNDRDTCHVFLCLRFRPTS